MAATHSNVIVRHNAWQNLWRAAAGERLLAGSALALSILLAFAASLPQTPSGDSAAYARWLSDMQTRFGGAASVLNALGLFDIIHSIVFRALGGVLGLAFVARLVDQLQAFRPVTHIMPPPDSALNHIDAPQPAGALLARLHGYRIHETATVTVADRYPLANGSSIAAHVGALILLIGLALSPLIDRRTEAVSAIPHSTTPVPGTAYVLQTSDIDEQGQVGLTLLEDGQPIVQGTAAPGRPMTAGGIGVYVRDLLPALRVTGRDKDGKTLSLQVRAGDDPAGEVLLTFNADRPDAFFVAPQARLAVRVSLTEQAAERRYEVSVYSSPDARLMARAQVRPADRLETAGGYLTFADESHATVDVVRAPAQWILVAGATVSMIGLFGLALFPARRIWLAPVEGGTRITCDDPHFDLSRFAARGGPA